VLEDAQTKVEAVITALLTYVTPLTPEERQTIPKMADKTIAFGGKAYDFAVANPSLRPSFLNMTNFQADIKDSTNLRTLANSVRQLFDMISDTEKVAGSEAYLAALGFYNNVKLLASQNVPGAQTVYSELKERFYRPGRGGQID
jgi:hypothetical protein